MNSGCLHPHTTPACMRMPACSRDGCHMTCIVVGADQNQTAFAFAKQVVLGKHKQVSLQELREGERKRPQPVIKARAMLSAPVYCCCDHSAAPVINPSPPQV